MSGNFIYKVRRVLGLFAFLMVLVVSANASFILVNDGILNEKVTKKVESLGDELYSKTAISVYVTLPLSLNGKSITEYEKEFSKNLREPFVLLTLAKNEKQVDIINSKVLDDKFDKEAVLSPYPWSGSILPLLTTKKENDQYNAALLNGYADIVEQIADSHDIKLEGALGNTNRNIYHYLKYGIYGFLLLLGIRYMYRKVRTKSE